MKKKRPGPRVFPCAPRRSVYIAEQMSHKDARFTLSVYAKAVKRRAKLHGAYLAEFERALAWATLPGTETALTGTGAHRDGEAVPQTTP